MKITKYAFRNLLTFQEKVAMEGAKAVNAGVRVLNDDLMSAQEIDLTAPELYQGLMYLASLGVLDKNRVGEIINVSPSAIPEGSIISGDEPPIVDATEGMKTFIVPIPKDVTRYIEWANQFCDAESYIQREGVNVIVKTHGKFTAPEAREVS